jgi:hypothetical protein
LLNDGKHFSPEVAVILRSSPQSGVAKSLTWESPANKEGWFGVFKILDVIVYFYPRKILLKDFLAERINLAEGDGLEPGIRVMQTETESADSRKKINDVKIH